MSKITKYLVIAITLFSMQWGVAAILVIANPKNPVSRLSKGAIRRIYLGKLVKIPGTRMVPLPVDQSQHSVIRAQFNKKIIGMSASTLMQYWSKRIFSGKGGPPMVVSGDSSVVSFVSRNTNAIGYINSDSRTSSVKVVNQF